MYNSHSILKSTYPTPSTFVCLINVYSLIADLHIFVYGRAQFSSISLERTKVKLLILNNFSPTNLLYI